MRVYFDVHVVFGGRLRIVSMRSLAESLKLHRHDWGASQVVSEHWFFDTPLVRSTCRITLPTDESSVKTILLKMRWIVLISSSFIPYLYSNSPLTFTCFVSALLPYSSLGSRKWVSVVSLGCSFLLLLGSFDI